MVTRIIATMKIGRAALFLLGTFLLAAVVLPFIESMPGEREYTVLRQLIMIAVASAVYCFVVGELTKNNSQVDKLWGLLPILYVWIVAYQGEFRLRLVVMALMVTVWGLRLTHNFSRRGAFRLKFWTGNEDHRWGFLRAKPIFRSKVRWSLFNLFFISFYQNGLILLFTLPILVAFQFDALSPRFTALDAFATVVMLALIVFEGVADNQQWAFQSEKHRRIAAGEELGGYERGFVNEGLWSLSRHPNYFAEQGIWVAFYLFSVAASGQVVNWSLAGALLLLVLFGFSSRLGEEISMGKYPEYAEYQRSLPRFLPLGGKKPIPSREEA